MQLENLSRKGEHYRITVIFRDGSDLREETADHYSLRVAKTQMYNDVTKQHESGGQYCLEALHARDFCV